MKKILVITVALFLTMGTPQASLVLGMIGIGGHGLGISSQDPLGVPIEIDSHLRTMGFSANFGQQNKPRRISYIRNDDGIQESIILSVGEEEYIQSISGTYLNTQHGYSKQKNTPAGVFMANLWSYAINQKPKFDRVAVGQIKIPTSIKFGGSPVKANIAVMRAKADGSMVSGEWEYSDSDLSEAMVLKLK